MIMSIALFVPKMLLKAVGTLLIATFGFAMIIIAIIAKIAEKLAIALGVLTVITTAIMLAMNNITWFNAITIIGIAIIALVAIILLQSIVEGLRCANRSLRKKINSIRLVPERRTAQEEEIVFEDWTEMLKRA